MNASLIHFDALSLKNWSLSEFCSEDERLLKVIQSLPEEEHLPQNQVAKIINDCLEVIFCSCDNLSLKQLTEVEIKVLELGLGFVPTPTGINEEELLSDFANFCRRVRCK